MSDSSHSTQMRPKKAKLQFARHPRKGQWHSNKKFISAPVALHRGMHTCIYNMKEKRKAAEPCSQRAKVQSGERRTARSSVTNYALFKQTAKNHLFPNILEAFTSARLRTFVTFQVTVELQIPRLGKAGPLIQEEKHNYTSDVKLCYRTKQSMDIWCISQHCSC